MEVSTRHDTSRHRRGAVASVDAEQVSLVE